MKHANPTPWIAALFTPLALAACDEAAEEAPPPEPDAGGTVNNPFDEGEAESESEAEGESEAESEAEGESEAESEVETLECGELFGCLFDDPACAGDEDCEDRAWAACRADDNCMAELTAMLDCQCEECGFGTDCDKDGACGPKGDPAECRECRREATFEGACLDECAACYDTEGVCPESGTCPF